MARDRAVLSAAKNRTEEAEKRAGQHDKASNSPSGEMTGYVLSQPAMTRNSPMKSSGVMLFLFIGLLVAGLIGTFLYLGEENAEPFLLFLLGGLAVIGIFGLFALAVGLVRFGDDSIGSEQPFTYLDALPDAHLVTDHEGRLVYADLAYARLTGAVGAQDIRSVERVFGVEEGFSEPVFRLSVAAAERRAASEEIRLDHPIGAGADRTAGPRWYRLSVNPVSRNLPAGGEAVKVGEGQSLWRIEDITSDRNDQEFAFQELQNVIHYLDHAPVGFFSAEPSGKIVYLNATLAEWLGIDLTKFDAGTLFVHDIVRGDGAALLNAVKAAPGETRTETIDVDFVKHNGQSLPVRLLHMTPFKSDGAPGATRTVVLNRSQAETGTNPAMESDARFSRFFNAAPIAIAALNRDGVLTRANATFIRLFRTGHVNNDKVSLIALVSDNDQEKLRLAIDAAAAGQSEISSVDIVLRGEVESNARLFLSAVDQVSDQVSDDRDDGDQEMAVVYAIDTTQQRALEQQFAQGQKMQAIGQLAGGIAHDFNNMLTAIIGFSDLLLQNHGPSDPSFQDLMNIKNNANRAAGLVRQLLAFSRRQTMRPKVIDLRDVVEDLSILLERLLGENVRLTVTHGRDLWAVKADNNQLEQVIMNLAVNARDAMPQGGDLSIETRNVTVADCTREPMTGLIPAEYVAIDVTDTGTGMSPEVMAKIFEPFFSTKGVGEGTGLGLATVYGIIKQTGGYIYPVSEVGKGTCFKILLPRHIVQEGELREAAPVETQRDLSGSARILLVEDEEAVRAFSVRALQARGHTVFEASSGAHALEVMEEVGGEVDLVVSDVVMPEMDGPTLLGELRKVRPDLKIIFVSGYAEDAFEKHLAAGQKFAFLPKPFTLKQLATKVKEVLENSDDSGA